MSYDDRKEIIEALMTYHDILLRIETDPNRTPQNRALAMSLYLDELLDSLESACETVYEHFLEYDNQVRLHENYARRNVNERSENPRAEPRAPPPPLGLAYLSKPKVKALKKSDMESNADDVCGICLDIPLRKNTIQMNCCKHSFCKTCTDTYVASALAVDPRVRSVACPMCRTKGFKYTEFRERKAPVRKPRAVAPQDMDNLVDLMSNVVI